ncbi:MAG: PilZ domain-containing protein, partial [Desulfobulbaceae bacterium]|nr:PilZ domain-containing protein [Desulfobulbaceae bacterium]
MTDGSEKREAYRAPLGTKVSWTAGNDEWNEDLSQDVSHTGMLIRTRQYVDPGTTINLKFKLPNLKFIE